MSQYGYHNKNIGDQMYGTPFGTGYNNITIRGEGIPEYIQTTKPSRNMTEAHMKTLRFFRKVCRMMPFILRIHEINYRVNTQQAKMNVANYIRKKDYVREPQIVDYFVGKGFEFLYEAEWHIVQSSFLFKFIAPVVKKIYQKEDRPNDRGFSYLKEKKYENKSTFLKDFYSGNKPNA